MSGQLQSFRDQVWRFFRAKRPSLSNGLLLIAAGGLGDLILLRYVLPRFLKFADKNEPVTLLVVGSAKKMAFLMPKSLEIIDVDFNKLRKNNAYRYQVMQKIYDRHYRRVISLDYLRHPLADEALMLAASADTVWAMQSRAWAKYQKLLNKNLKKFDKVCATGPEHTDKILRLADFADQLSGEKSDLPVLKLDLTELKSAAQKKRPLYIFQPFSAVKAKQSGPDVYLKIIQLLPENADILITGAPDDLESNRDFKVLLEAPNVRFEDALFEDLVGFLRAADLVVSVDTAVMHLSAGLGAPTLCLASAAYVGEIVPYAHEISPSNVTVLYTPMPECQGCLGDCVLPFEQGRYACVDRLDVERIEQAVKKFIQS